MVGAAARKPTALLVVAAWDEGEAQTEWQAGLASLQDALQQMPGISVVQARAKAGRGSPS